MQEKKSKITVRETNKRMYVQIGNDYIPDTFQSITDKWQSLIDTIAKIVDVPSGLIMKLNEKTIEVFIKNNSDENPYHTGEKTPLDYGLYCENVIGTQSELVVSDATKSNIWKDNNPDIDINMISYLGYPINWPDGKVFGTVCLLDNKENSYNEYYKKLLYLTKEHIESDLRLLKSKQELETLNKELKETGSIKTRFLSLISHDVRGGIGTLNSFLKLIISNFDDYDEQKLKNDLVSLHQVADSSYMVLENLLNWSKNDMLHLDVENVQFDLIQMIDNILDFFSLSIKMKNIQIDKEYFDDNINIDADKYMINSALRNIISNSIKYNIKGGKVFIRSYRNNGKIILSIEDTGIGMEKNTIEKLFSYSEAHQEKGTYGESSAGLGLLLTKEFLDKNNIEVNVNSELGKGTKFEIEI